MIYTSYFANYNKFPQECKLVSIALYPPKWFNFDYTSLPMFTPSKDLLKKYKNNTINDAQYEEIFFSELHYAWSAAHIAQTLIELDQQNSLLLCFEKKSKFCHRTLVHKLVNTVFSHLAIEIKEL